MRADMQEEDKAVLWVGKRTSYARDVIERGILSVTRIIVALQPRPHFHTQA